MKKHLFSVGDLVRYEPSIFLENKVTDDKILAGLIISLDTIAIHQNPRYNVLVENKIINCAEYNIFLI